MIDDERKMVLIDSKRYHEYRGGAIRSQEDEINNYRRVELYVFRNDTYELLGMYSLIRVEKLLYTAVWLKLFEVNNV